MPLAVFGAALAALLAYLLTSRRSSAMTTSNPAAQLAPSPAGRPRAELTPKAGSDRDAARIRTLAGLLSAVWSDVTGLPGQIPPAALEILLAHAGAEGTGYGQGWDHEMIGSNNVASYMGKAPTTWYNLAPHGDTRPQADGTSKPITANFRYYKDGIGPDGRPHTAAENGAIDFLISVTQRPFPALPELQQGSVLDYARRLNMLGYYEGFNPESPMGGRVTDWQTRWADSLAYLAQRGELESRSAHVKATPEQVAGRIALYARSMGRRLPEIAAALGHSTVNAYVPADLA